MGDARPERITREEKELADSFFPYVRLRVEDDFRFSYVDRNLDRALKEASEEIGENRFHFYEDNGGVTCQELGGMFPYARENEIIGFEGMADYIFLISIDDAKEMLRKNSDSKMEQLVDKVVEILKEG